MTTANQHMANMASNSSVADYIALMKPRVMTLVIFSSVVGMVLAPSAIHPLIALVAILCIIAGSGSAAAINMWYDRDIDAIMLRTRKRPIVRGAILPEEALAFGIITGFLSVFVMFVCVSQVAGLLLLSSILFYILVYTMWLKRFSVQNIVIGGTAGAIPPMIGWAAVTNDISIGSISLFLLIFLWTPPHFWSLALYKSDDYRACNVPMMPVVKGDRYTKQNILLYTILTAISSYLPHYLGIVGITNLMLLTPLNMIFLAYAILLFKDHNNRKYAPKMFGFSILYLFLTLASYLATAH